MGNSETPAVDEQEDKKVEDKKDEGSSTESADKKKDDKPSDDKEKKDASPDAKKVAAEKLKEQESLVKGYINNKLLSLGAEALKNPQFAEKAGKTGLVLLGAKDTIVSLVLGREDEASGLVMFLAKQAGFDLVEVAKSIQIEIAEQDPTFSVAKLKAEVSNNTSTTPPTSVETPPVGHDADDGESDDYNDVTGPDEDVNLDDLANTMSKDMVPVAAVQSVGFRKNPETGTTLCSQTANLDLQHMGLPDGTFPKGNAFDAKDMYGSGKYVVGYEAGSGNKIVDIAKSIPSKTNDMKGNLFDIFIPAKMEKNKKYGHRLIGFRSEPSNQIWILDPYNTGKSRAPIKREDYKKKVCDGQHRDVVKIVAYETKKKVVDTEQVKMQVAVSNTKAPLANAA